jgi:hypothetical protein
LLLYPVVSDDGSRSGSYRSVAIVALSALQWQQEKFISVGLMT